MRAHPLSRVSLVYSGDGILMALHHRAGRLVDENATVRLWSNADLSHGTILLQRCFSILLQDTAINQHYRYHTTINIHSYEQRMLHNYCKSYEDGTENLRLCWQSSCHLKPQLRIRRSIRCNNSFSVIVADVI